MEVIPNALYLKALSLYLLAMDLIRKMELFYFRILKYLQSIALMFHPNL